MAEVRLDGVSKAFGATQALEDVTLTAPDGGFFVLLGPTGAGKTTALRLVAGLEAPDAGRIVIGGHDARHMSPAARDVAFVFQQYSLYPHLTVFENLAFPLRAPARAIPAAAIEARVREVAALLRIDHKLGNRATKLSGGEMQRVAIGRALVRRPRVYLMDEPLSSLDAKLRAELRIELKRIQKELGATILYVTHDQTEAMTMATTVGVLREGRLVQTGSPRQIYEDPDDLWVAERLGQPRINVAPVGFYSGPRPAAATRIGFRTEHLALGGDGPEGRVARVEHLGDQSRVHFEADGVEIVALADPHAGLRAGDRARIGVRDPLFFDADGRRIRS